MRKVQLLALLASVFVTMGAFAQQAPSDGTTVNSTSNSQVSSGATSSAANQGNAQNITFQNAAQPTHTTQRIETAPGMGLGSFGTSFSSDNCSNTIAGQLSVVGFGASAGKALLEQNCAHIRRGFAFGQAAAFAAANHQQDLAMKMQAMVSYEFCLADGPDSPTAHACEDLGLITGAKNTRDDHPGPVSRAQAEAIKRQQEATQQQQQQAVADQQATQGTNSTLNSTSVANQNWYRNTTH